MDLRLLDPTTWFERRPEIGGNTLVIKGTRVPIRTLLASLAEGSSTEEILTDFPTVSSEALRAVIAFAAASQLIVDRKKSPIFKLSTLN